MDLILRGRGADISARAPLWFVRLCGAALGFSAFLIADVLGLTLVTGFSSIVLGVLAAVSGALIAPGRFGVALWIVLIMLSLTMAIVTYTPVVQAPALHFVRADADDAPVDAVVVLSGTMTAEGLITSDVLMRLTSGVIEARRRGVRTIALSVIDGKTGGGHISSERDQSSLMQQLAPDLELLLVRGVQSSRDEALQFVALGRTHRWQRIALVTSPLHTRRACRTFEVAGLPVSCVPAQAREYSLRRLGGAHARLNVFRDMMYETLATVFYATRGWV